MLVTSLTITPGSCFAGRTIHCVKTDLGGQENGGHWKWLIWMVLLSHLHAWYSTVKVLLMITHSCKEKCSPLHLIAKICGLKIGKSKSVIISDQRKLSTGEGRVEKKEKDCALASRVPVESFYSCLSKCVTTSKYSSSEIFSIPRSSHWHRVRGCNFACTRQGRFSKKCA